MRRFLVILLGYLAFAAIVAICVEAGHSQSTVVIQLSPDDAKAAKAAYDARDAADKRIQELASKIRENYGIKFMPFTYSTDFKFVVPDTHPVLSPFVLEGSSQTGQFIVVPGSETKGCEQPLDPALKSLLSLR